MSLVSKELSGIMRWTLSFKVHVIFTSYSLSQVCNIWWLQLPLECLEWRLHLYRLGVLKQLTWANTGVGGVLPHKWQKLYRTSKKYSLNSAGVRIVLWLHTTLKRRSWSTSSWLANVTCNIRFNVAPSPPSMRISTYMASLVPMLLVGGEKKSLVSTVHACA